MVLHRFQKKGTRALQVQVLIMTHTLTEITTGKSGIAAEAVEFIQSHWYSGLGLLSLLLTFFEDQALKLLSCSKSVLSCSGLDPCFLAR